MAFIRKIRGYYYLVESYREGKKVKQRNLKYMGKTKPAQEQIISAIKEIK